MESIKEILMRRDNMSEESAEDLIDQARYELKDLLEEGETEAAYNICEEYFGLKPDYLDELI